VARSRFTGSRPPGGIVDDHEVPGRKREEDIGDQLSAPDPHGLLKQDPNAPSLDAVLPSDLDAGIHGLGLELLRGVEEPGGVVQAPGAELRQAKL
jgi:hypothetical protein